MGHCGARGGGGWWGGGLLGPPPAHPSCKTMECFITQDPAVGEMDKTWTRATVTSCQVEDDCPQTRNCIYFGWFEVSIEITRTWTRRQNSLFLSIEFDYKK